MWEYKFGSNANVGNFFVFVKTTTAKPWYPNMKIEGHLKPKSCMQNSLPTLIKHFSFPAFVQKYWEIKKVHESQKVTGKGYNKVSIYDTIKPNTPEGPHHLTCIYKMTKNHS